MHIAVIYDTRFGNTARIAKAIARGVGSAGTVEVMDLAGAAGPLAARPDLVLIGGPTQRRGASPTLRAFLEALPASLRGVPAGSFDTRYRGAKLLMGSAAVETAKHLEKAGGEIVAPPESFFIARRGTMEVQQLEAGELERAEAWGRAMAASTSPAVGAVS